MPASKIFASALVFAFGVIVSGLATAAEKDDSWGQWRGPLGTGVSLTADPPLKWGETENIRWKTELPGKGHSTPVIWKNRLYLTAAVPFGKPRLPVYDEAPGSHDNLPVIRSQRFVVLAVDRADGKILWQTPVHETFPHAGGHVSGSLASNSPVTDGEVIVAFFGSHGLYGLDPSGKILWQKDLGKMQTKHAHGEGASPVMHGDLVVVNWDHEAASAIHAFDKRTGEKRWRVARDEKTSWSTPIVVEHGGKFQVIVSATKRIRSYALKTGELIWECGGLSNNVVASPIAGNGMVIAGSSYEKKAMVAIKLEGAAGDITHTDQVVWRTNQRTPYVPSPLLYEDSLYFFNHYQGILSCLDPATGEKRAGPFRLGALSNIYASPVAAAGRIYITDLDGTTMVLKHGPEPTPLGVNHLDDVFSASAAISGKDLYLRGAKFLYGISEELVN
ncbi:MAG: outer membrane protein assembly factor BamB [Verrucomicrobiales bacterium]|jgi:outer membrane protein assembly factor BamB